MQQATQQLTHERLRMAVRRAVHVAHVGQPWYRLCSTCKHANHVGVVSYCCETFHSKGTEQDDTCTQRSVCALAPRRNLKAEPGVAKVKADAPCAPGK